jgi:hypothetical protein
MRYCLKHHHAAASIGRKVAESVLPLFVLGMYRVQVHARDRKH